MLQQIAAERLHNQFVSRPFRGGPAALVARFGAVQAQEYPFAKWGLALRLARQVPDTSVEAACDAGEILRTHVLRPTWHFVARRDIRWLLALTGPRVLRALSTYALRAGIDARMLTRGAAIIERSLGKGRPLTRPELAARLARAGLPLAGTPLAFMAMHAELEGVMCSGPRRDGQSTYALLDERAPDAKPLPLDEALATLVMRYFSTHGPATVRDFVWWSGLTVSETRRGLALVRATRQSIGGLDYWRTGAAGATTADDIVRLLPIYDEYLVAYRDRLAVPHATPAALPTGVTFRHALVIDGHVGGTWNVRKARQGWAVRVHPVRRLSTAEKNGVAAAAGRFGRFLATPVSLAIE
jgi:hypothetical protein